MKKLYSDKNKIAEKLHSLSEIWPCEGEDYERKTEMSALILVLTLDLCASRMKEEYSLQGVIQRSQ